MVMVTGLWIMGWVNNWDLLEIDWDLIGLLGLKWNILEFILSVKELWICNFYGWIKGFNGENVNNV